MQKDAVTLVVLSNNSSSVGNALGRELFNLINGHPYDDPLGRATAASPLSPGTLGDYQFGPDFFTPNMTAHIERDGPTLVMRASSGDTWLLPLGGSRYLDR